MIVSTPKCTLRTIGETALGLLSTVLGTIMSGIILVMLMMIDFAQSPQPPKAKASLTLRASLQALSTALPF